MAQSGTLLRRKRTETKRKRESSCGRSMSKWFTEEQRLLWFALQKFWDRSKLVSTCHWRGEGATHCTFGEKKKDIRKESSTCIEYKEALCIGRSADLEASFGKRTKRTTWPS